MQTAFRVRSRALVVARQPPPSRRTSVALVPLQSRLPIHASRPVLPSLSYSSSSFPDPLQKKAHRLHQLSDIPAVDSLDQRKGRVGVGLALAAVGIACAVMDETVTEAKERTEDKTLKASEQKREVEDDAKTAAAVGVTASQKRALKKRKSSVKDGNVVVSSAAVRGDRAYMEDTSFVSSCNRFAAVYDGHGGAAVSQFLRDQLFSTIAPELARLDQEVQVETKGAAKGSRRQKIAVMLHNAVHKLDDQVIAKDEWKFQGSTAVGVFMFEDVLYSLNVGDSRAVLCRSGEVVELTRDHKPNDPQERARIESLGGRVQWFGYVDAQGEPIEPYGAYRVNGNLAVARAIGDRDSRPYVNGEVEIRQYDIEHGKDEFIVIASDGLWDVFTSSEVVEFVQDVMSGELGGREAWSSGGHSDTRVPIFEWSQQYTSDRSMIKAARRRRKVQIANYLVQEALFRGTSDNVSVVVVWLR
uniref:PPM-type phosphatase domain-containing protein n=1 Tax=Hyaloperonospora arabidopsidis (strain Emoy2) TaxID=559515 RepID=M4B3H9_HYAAE